MERSIQLIGKREVKKEEKIRYIIKTILTSHKKNYKKTITSYVSFRKDRTYFIVLQGKSDELQRF